MKNMRFGISIVLTVIVIFSILFYLKSTKPASPAAIDGIACNSDEGAAEHIHAHLTIINNGKEVPVPAKIGIHEEAGCLYWVHTHDDDPGVIHIESPVKKDFTLGNFFDIWGQKLSDTQVMNYSNGKEIQAFVNGKAYHGDPSKIKLDAHADIVLEIGPDFVPVPKAYVFPDGL